MKIGTLIINPYVREEHPCYELVYIGISGKFFKALDKTLNLKKYYKSDLKDFKIVGECRILKKYFEQIENKEIAKEKLWYLV